MALWVVRLDYWRRPLDRSSRDARPAGQDRNLASLLSPFVSGFRPAQRGPSRMTRGAKLGRKRITKLRRRPEIDESGRIVMSGGDSQRAERCILWVHDR